MKNFSHKIIILITIILVVTTSCFSQNAKRRPPKPVVPIIVDSVEYSAPDSNMGYIVARNLKTDSIIWEKKIYEVTVIKDLEEDVQWIFIDSIKIRKGNLLIRNEKGNCYNLNLGTLKVTDIKQTDFINY